MIPVKANAYGCGISTILPFIEKSDIDMLGIANLREGKEIRNLGFRKEILLLGAFYKNDIHALFQEKITPTITDLWQISFLDKEAKNKKEKLCIHIKFDLGMGRLGILPHQKEELFTAFKKANHLTIKGIMTHFPSGDRKSSLIQLKNFLSIAEETIKTLSLKREEIILHCANSYAILNYPESALDMVRPGIIFYGYFHNYRDYQKLKNKFPIKPCIRLTAEPFSYRILKKEVKYLILRFIQCVKIIILWVFYP